MRNTKIALAVLALVASTAAMAEGVTISGVLDAGVANTTSTNATGTAKVGTYFSGAGGFVAGNNLNFSGSEDLSGGMKVGFTLGMGYDAGNGSFGNGGSGAAFTQQANVSLSSDMGSLKLGQQLSPFISSIAGTGMLGNGHFFVNRLLSIGGGSESNVTNAGSAGSGAGNGGFFIANAISYTTPAIEGFTATILTTPKSGSQGSVNTTPAEANAYTAGSITGAIGDIGVSGAYHTRQGVYSAYSASANYKLGEYTFVGNAMSSDYEVAGPAGIAGDKINSWGVGVGYDASEKVNLALQYAKNNVVAGAQSLVGAHLKYSLSKRTFTYFSYTNATNGAASAYEGRAYPASVQGATLGLGNTSTVSNHTAAVGIAHSF